MNPVQLVRRQGQFHKSEGGGDSAAYGNYTAELYDFLEATTGADREVVAAVADKKIRVLSYSLSGNAGTVSTAVWKSAAAAIDSTKYLAQNGFIGEADENGLFETAAGEALNINVSANVSARVTYILVD